MTPPALRLYHAVSRLAGPVVRRHLARRARAGKEDPARLPERFGRPSLPRPPGPLLWLHAVSVGEATSCLPLLEALRARRPGLALLVTTGTATSARVMAARLPPGAVHQMAPVDLPAAVDRFLDHWRPDALVVVEEELWPNLLTTARARGAATALVQGRLSERAARRWARAPAAARHLLAGFAPCLAQSDADAARLTALGARRAVCLGSLKAAGPPPADPAALADARRLLAGRRVVVAAATHRGEEAAVARAHREARAARPDLLTLLVPRHPERGAAVAAELAGLGRAVARRSRGEAPPPATDVYLADTLGELGLWYRLADLAFVGGSLVDRGGHNPFEAAALGLFVLIGPHTANAAAAVSALEAAGALERVADGASLAAALVRALDDPAGTRRRGAAGRAAVAAEASALGRVLDALTPLLPEAERAPAALLGA